MLKSFKNLKLFRTDDLEYEFLPPELEIEKNPASPLGRGLIWMVFIITIIAIVWSCIGKVDEVAVARGKLIPDGRVKVIQPVEEGVIRAIHVKDGELVKKGQLLIELDPTIDEADVEINARNLEIFRIQREILIAELEGKNLGDISQTLSQSNLDEEAKLNLKYQKQLGDTSRAEYMAKEKDALLSIAASQNDLKAAQELLNVYEKDVELITKQRDMLAAVNRAGGTSDFDLLTKEQELNAAQQNVSQQQCVVARTENNLVQLQAQKEIPKVEFDKELLGNLQDTEKNISSLEGELIKAKKHLEMEHLLSPVSGTVQALASNTIGGVVTPAQAIAMVVPDGTSLVVEAKVLNQDIGFVKNNQKAEVKLDTFPFQKYGTISGKVVSISPDAVDDEKLGPVYNIKVTLDSNTIRVNGNDEKLSPGMTASVEVKTGQRRIIEFFLSPIIKYAKESLTLR